MENIIITQQKHFCAALAIFWVVFVWGFWEKGPYALGFNAFLFLTVFFGVFIWILWKAGAYTKSDLIWILPVSFIILSFTFYDNPFIKMVSIPVLPILFVLFYNQALLPNKQKNYWGFEFLIHILIRVFSFVGQLGESVKIYTKVIIPVDNTSKQFIIRIVAGVVIFLVAALMVFLPLLSSADAVFSEKARVITNWLQSVFSTPIAYRTVVFAVLSVLFFSMLTAWSKQFYYKEREKSNTQIDSIIVGIILAGVLCIYMFFLWVQISRLWIGELPFNFKETEQLVKSGFWQLLFLSIINILIYFFAYRKTVPFVQKLLAVFTITSLFLLISAGHRMGLYVVYYGFSYEKFFASYAVLFCAILFFWLISQLFRSRRANIAKFLTMLFLWMFALVSIFPVEQFIFRANIALFHREGSRIMLHEMKMLSPDALPLVKKYQERDLSLEEYDWNHWIEKQEKIITQKRWYERNVMNIVYMSYFSTR